MNPDNRPSASKVRSLARSVLQDGSFASRALVVAATAAGAFAACAAPAGGPNGGPNGGNGGGNGGTGANGTGTGSTGMYVPRRGSRRSFVYDREGPPELGVWLPPTANPECTDPAPGGAPPLYAPSQFNNCPGQGLSGEPKRGLGGWGPPRGGGRRLLTR